MTPSDFNAEELFVVSYYPLLIAQIYVALPRIADGNELMRPEFETGRDSDEIFALLRNRSRTSLPASPLKSQIDFPENALKVLTEVERMAPISVSPEGSYVLYGAL